MAMVFTIGSKRCCKNSSSLQLPVSLLIYLHSSLSKRSFVPSSLPSFCIALLVGKGPRFSSPLTAYIRAELGHCPFWDECFNTITHTIVVSLCHSMEPSPPPPPAVRCHRCMGCWKAMTRASSPWSRRGVGGGSWDHG